MDKFTQTSTSHRSRRSNHVNQANHANHNQSKWLLGLMFLMVMIMAANSYAADQNIKLWTKLDVDGPIATTRFKYWLDAELRLVSRHNHFESAQFEAMLGYSYSPTLDFWLGYKRTQNPYHEEAAQRNTVWEEVDWVFFKCATMKWIWRTRFEQERPTDNVVWLLIVRERLKVIFPLLFRKNIVPTIWDEVFFHLKGAPYASNKFVSQNRLLLGFDISMAKTDILEIGYMNQLLFNSQPHHPHEINHTLYIDYSFNL